MLLWKPRPKIAFLQMKKAPQFFFRRPIEKPHVRYFVHLLTCAVEESSLVVLAPSVVLPLCSLLSSCLALHVSVNSVPCHARGTVSLFACSQGCTALKWFNCSWGPQRLPGHCGAGWPQSPHSPGHRGGCSVWSMTDVSMCMTRISMHSYTTNPSQSCSVLWTCCPH